MAVSGKNVFVTGGARGIGRGITETLLSVGARVLFCDIREELGKATETELQKQHGVENVAFEKCDVTDSQSLRAAFEAALSKFGSVHICINNAGIADEKNWEQMFAVNVVSHIHGSQLALDHMRRDKGGKGGLIVNVVSDAGFMSFPYIPHYVATKHAMLGFTTSWARNPKMSEWGVKWRCFCPCPTNTQLVDAGPGVDLMEVEDVAREFMKMLSDLDNTDVVFLVRKNGASGYVRRQLVDSDGVSDLVTVDAPRPSAL